MKRKTLFAAWWSVLPLLVIGGGIGCGDDGDDDASEPGSTYEPSPSPVVATTPPGDDDVTLGDDDASAPDSSITITAPTAGEVQFPFNVDVAIENFVLNASAVGGAPVEGEGHWHLMLDGAYYNYSATSTLLVDSISPGSHALQAQLVNNDHSVLDPTVVSQTVTVTVPAPTIVITAPTGGEVNSRFTVTVDVKNYVLDPVIVTDDDDLRAGRGHWHLFVDGVYENYSTEASLDVDLSDLSPGTHTLSAELVQKNHASLEPKVVSNTVTVTIPDNEPRIDIVSPVTGAIGFPFTVTITTENFTLDPANVNGAAEEGSGHWHLNIDGVYYNYSATNEMVVDKLSSGLHLIQAELVNNDHSSLSPKAVSQTIELNVAAPTIALTYPNSGTVSPTFTVIVDVDNFVLDPSGIDGANVAGHGHWHLYVDSQYYNYSATTTLAVKDLALGSHTIYAELVQNNHQSFNPKILTQTYTANVAEEPTITIISPTGGSVGFPFTVSVDIQNFNLDPDHVGGTNQAGYGHWHLLVDGEYYNFSATTSLYVDELSAGAHTLQAVLVNNDHTYLSPSVVSNVANVTVQNPSVAIISPADGSSVISPVSIEVAVENFVLDSAVGGDNVEGHGHYHVYIDDDYAGASYRETFDLGDLDVGAHLIEVRLAGNDHYELSPQVGDIVEIRVTNEPTEAQPAISIVSPEAYEQITTNSTEIGVAVENFILNPSAVGGTNVEGYGHYHIFLDGTYQSFSASDTAVVTGLTSGTHEIKVQLVENNHTALDPEASDSVLVRVTIDGAAVSAVPSTTVVNPRSTMSLTISTDNFTLADPALNQSGTGFYRVYFDNATNDDYLVEDYRSTTEITIPDAITEGNHFLRVVLYNQDGSPADATSATVNLTVQWILYDRLGREEGISAVVGGLLERVANDNRINAYFLNSYTDLAKIDLCLTKQFGNLTGGPQVYPDSDLGCRDMKTTHEKLGISTQDYYDLAFHLVDELNEVGVSAEDIDTIVGVLTQEDFTDDIIEDPTDDATIYQRVGRKPAIQSVIGDFIGRVVADSKINGYFLNDSLNADRLSTCLTNFVCSVDGPCSYGQESELQSALYIGDAFVPCVDMLSVHAGLHISDQDYLDLAGHLVDALTAAAVASSDIDTLATILLSDDFKGDIVEDEDNNDSVYQRVGRKPAIEYVVGDFINRVVGDSKINAYFLNNNLKPERLTTCLVNYVCSLDGPCRYGEESTLQSSLYIGDEFFACFDMKTIHTGMGISSEDYSDLAGHLVSALDDAGVTDSDIDIIAGALTADEVVNDIVEDPTSDETIYQRVGRKPAIEYVVSDFIGRVVADPKISGYFLNSTLDADRLSACLVNYVCGLDGPCRYGQENELQDELFIGDAFYPCFSMEQIHTGLGISTNDFNDLAGHLVGALTDAGVASDDIDAIAAALTTDEVKADIIEDPDSNLTVYQRVGRKEAIEWVIDSLVASVVGDTSLVGFFAYTDAARLDTCLVRQVCDIDGPCVYGKEVEPEVGNTPCRDMLSTHEGLTDSNDDSPILIEDFNALVVHLVDAMNQYGVSTSDQDAILSVLGPLCTDIVDDPSTCP